MSRAQLVGQFIDGSPEWHAARADSLGGSEVAAVLGLSPWQSPFSLWHAKRNGWISDANPEMEWGHYLEPALLAWFEDHHGCQLERGWTYQRNGWRHANPDGVVTSFTAAMQPRPGDVVEAKKASADDQWGTPGTDEVPPYYRVQGIWYMDVLQSSRCLFVVTNLGRSPEVYVVDYDPAEARLIRGHAAAFWRSLRHDQPPPLDGHDATYQTVRRLHPDIDGDTVELGDLGSKFLELKAARSTVTSEWNRIRSQVADAMGAAQYATHDGRRIARRQAKSDGAPYVVAI